MAIATRTEIKELLQITGTSNDDLIDTLIPIISDWMFQYCNNKFFDNRVVEKSSDIYFTSNNTINLDDGGFTDDFFTAGMEINVTGSILNEGNFILQTVTDTVLTVTTTDIVTENFDETITVTRVVYPVALKNLLSSLIAESIEYGKRKAGAKSEGFSDFSITYASSGLFSGDSLQILSQYRVIRAS